MTTLRRSAAAIAMAMTLSATPAFAEPATEVSAPGLSPDLFLVSAAVAEEQPSSVSSFAGLSHLEMKTSAGTIGEGRDPWMMWGVMFGSVFLMNSVLAYDAFDQTTKLNDPGKMPWLAALLNFALSGAGYIYNGQNIPLGVGLTLGALGLTWVEFGLLDAAKASGK